MLDLLPLNCTLMSFMKGWSKERVVSDCGSSGRLLLVLASDSAAQVKKVSELCSQLEQSMGMTPGWLLPSFTAATKAGAASRESVFLQISPVNAIVGVLVLEQLGTRGGAGGVGPTCRDPEQLGARSSAAAAAPLACLPKAAAIEQRHAPADPLPATSREAAQAREACCADAADPLPATSREAAQGAYCADAADLPAANMDGTRLLPETSGPCGALPNHCASHRLQRNNGATAAAAGPGSAASQRYASGMPVCGVRMVWVSHTHRRKGLATRMLDAAR